MSLATFIFRVLCVFAGVLILACCDGCKGKAVTYTLTRPDGTTESFTYANDSFSTHIGKGSVTRTTQAGDTVKVELESLDSQSQAIDLAKTAVQIVGEKLKAAP
jgi:hypothetical protein